MTTRFAIDQNAVPTSTGTDNMDVTSTGLGSENGKAAIWLGTWANQLDSAHDNQASIGLGFNNSTTQEACTGMGANDNAATNTSFRRVSVTNCYNLIGQTDQTIRTGITINSAITNGFSTDVTKGNTRADYVSTGLFNGDGLTIAVGTVDEGTTAEDSTFSKTGLGFQPDCVIFSAVGGYAGAGNGTGGIFSVGVADSSGNQFAYGININDNADPSEHDARISDTTNKRCILSMLSNPASPGGPSWSWEFVSMDAGGFTLRMRDATGNNAAIPFIALKSTDWDFKVGNYDVPTSGNITESGLGLTPSFLFEVITQVETEDADITGGDAGAFAIIMNDGTNEVSHSIASQDNVSTTLAHSFISSNDTTVMDHTAVITGGEAIVGTTAFSSGQFVKTLTDWPAAVKKAFYLVGGVSTTSETVTIDLVSKTGNPQSSLSSVSWAWFDEDIGALNAPTDKGSAEVSDSSGQMILDLPGTSLTTGQTGTLILYDSTGSKIGTYRVEID
jgi:hypothetical protein